MWKFLHLETAFVRLMRLHDGCSSASAVYDGICQQAHIYFTCGNDAGSPPMLLRLGRASGWLSTVSSARRIHAYRRGTVDVVPLSCHGLAVSSDDF